MSDAIKMLDDSTFNETIASGVVLIDFWATWCGPCRAMMPVIEQIADEYVGRAVVAKVDIEQAGQTGMHYGIRVVPTLLVFKDGKVVNEFVGVQEKSAITEALDKALE